VPRRAEAWLGFYPLLFAVAPALAIAGQSIGQFRASDLAVVLVAIAGLAAIALGMVFVVVRALDRTDRTAPLAAALCLLAVAWCFYYIPLQSALSGVHRRLASNRVLVPLGAALTLAAAAWLLRQPRQRLIGLSGFMARFGILLVAIVAARTAASAAGGPGAARRSTLVQQLAAPVRTLDSLPPGRNDPRRDIYLIVLDGHANARVLQEVLGYDNRPFEDSLRALGFLVPRDVRSNYVQTYLSLSSLLNATHVTSLAADAGVASKDHSLPTYLVKHNRAARVLKEHGYKYVLFPSAWWAATASSPLADVEFDPHRAFSPVRELRRTELRLAVLRSSLLRLAVGSDSGEAPMVEHFLRSFEGLQELPYDPAPTFAFAHFLLPHIPYLLDAGCGPLAHVVPDDQEADTPEQRADYVGQVRCADRLVLDLVTTLLQRSPTRPVILVVGDHGSRFSDVGFYGHPEHVSPAFVRERFGAFGAFYLPAGGDSLFRQPVTLVNVVGNVLRYYLGLDLPPSADDMYVSGEQLYRFYHVDGELLRDDRADAARSPGRERDARTWRANGECASRSGPPCSRSTGSPCR
jgi:hypothetical protein